MSTSKSNPLGSDKSSLRKHFTQLRDNFAASNLAKDAVVALASNVLEVMPGPPGICASYINKHGEASLQRLHDQADAWEFAFPRVNGDHLDFFVPQNDQTMVPNQWGIMEPLPESSKAVGLGQVKCVLVPGVAFDHSGHRLGHGKGFYDRALVGFTGLKIGIAFDAQIYSKKLPVADHDIVMDWVVTEKRTIRPENGAEAERTG